MGVAFSFARMCPKSIQRSHCTKNCYYYHMTSIYTIYKNTLRSCDNIYIYCYVIDSKQMVDPSVFVFGTYIPNVCLMAE